MPNAEPPPYDVQVEDGIPVHLPSGAVYYVLTSDEQRYLVDRITRYLADNHFVNVSDMQDIDRMITFELLIHRWTLYLSKGRDYFDDDIDTKKYSDMVQDYSREVRQLKKSLGVDKSTRDRTRGDDSVAALWDNLRRRAQEFGYMRNAQFAQVITSFQRIQAMIQFRDNCLAGETPVITRSGVRPIAALVGHEVELLDANGGWVKSEVTCRGEQELWTIELDRDGARKIVRATAEHRWFAHKRTANGRQRELTTAELEPGDRLVSIYGKHRHLDPSPWGIARGITFGDGSLQDEAGAGCIVRLCGEKAELLKWFPLSPTRTTGGDPVVTGLPWDWKDAPPLDADSAFLLGWLAGYFAADGSVDLSGCPHLDSADRRHVELARDVCVRLGLATTGISSYVRTGYGATSTMWRLRFPLGALGPELLLRTKHANRYRPRSSRSFTSWKVMEVRQRSGWELVYCPAVPTTRSFVLEGNILTGNCDPQERKENACEDGDVIEVIREEVAKFNQIDEKFRFERQAIWVRQQ